MVKDVFSFDIRDCSLDGRKQKLYEIMCQIEYDAIMNVLLVNIFHAVISKHTRDALSTYAHTFLLNILLKETIIFKVLW